MPPKQPLLFLDNVFDTVNQYLTGIVEAHTERSGHEAFRVGDYRRERTSWQASAAVATSWVRRDLGAGVSRPVDSIYIDRGHNLWGKTLVVLGDNGVTGVAEVSTGLSVPALGTLGGDPTTGWCVTEEGALYRLFPALASRQRWWVYVSDIWAPIIPGIILGMRTQLLGFSRTFDEDAGERTEVTATSRAGYRGTDKTYAWRTIELDLKNIGSTEYDGTMRTCRKLMFEKNQPWVCAMDHGTYPERAWMYQYEGKSWGMPKQRVYRSGRIRGREVGASIS